jgi:hypothetical protein
MKKAIELADTTFRAYKKKNGATVLHLRSYLVVYADVNFRTKIREAGGMADWTDWNEELMKKRGLSAFFKVSPNCWLKFPNGERHKCSVGYCYDPEARSFLRPASDGQLYFQKEDITDGECVLFLFFIEVILRDKNTDIFGDGNLFGLSVAEMQLSFCINFPERPPNEKIVFKRRVPIVRRGRGW